MAFVDAVLWDGTKSALKCIKQLIIGPFMCRDENGELNLHTLDGFLTVSLGEYFIRGDELYSCKSDVFKAAYEVVE